MIERWGGFVARRALAVLLAGLAVTLAAGAYGAGVFDSLSQGGFDDPGSESARELALEQETFGNQSVDVVAIYSSDELTADQPEFQQRVEDVVAGLPAGTTATVVPYYAAPDADHGLRRRARRAGADLAGRLQSGRLPDQTTTSSSPPSRPRGSRPTSPASSPCSTTSTRSPPRTSPAPS